MINRNTLLLIFVGLLIPFFYTSIYAREVKSLSSRSFIEEDGNGYWQIAVRCTGISKPRYIIRFSKEGEWCAKDLPGLCDADRVNAATQVCSSQYTSRFEAKREADALAENNAVNKLKIRAALIAEQLSVEKQLIDLEQRKLDLRRRELELEKRELRMQDRLPANQ